MPRPREVHTQYPATLPCGVAGQRCNHLWSREYQPTARGVRIRYSRGKRMLIDGPFAESKEVIAGYTLIQVDSREQAMEWAQRFPPPHGPDQDSEIEIRQLYELDDLGPSAAVDRFRQLEVLRR
ncbi:MAG: hypothetical protein HC872_02885 [Gammaproteobacteria bacterium]|nr:hypothetical protein [Gammaproteobacteria bacterium]